MHHAVCVGMTTFLKGPYYCPSCRQEAEHTGYTCISMDRNVMAKVITGKLAAEGQEVVHLIRAASWLLWEGDQLYNSAR